MLLVTILDIATPEQVTEQLEAAQLLLTLMTCLLFPAPERRLRPGIYCACFEHLPRDPYSEDMETDALPEDLVAEFVREKLFNPSPRSSFLPV